MVAIYSSEVTSMQQQTHTFRMGRLTLPLVCSILFATVVLSHLFFGFEADELQHLRFAWNIAQGQVPYRDFFEHHPPVMHYMLAPWVHGLTNAGLPLLIVCRLVAAMLSIGCLVGIFCFLRDRLGRTAAWWGCLIWIVIPPFADAGVELRPDWVSLPLLLMAAYLLWQGVCGERGRKVNLLAGLLAGASLTLTQKASFPIIGMGLWVLGTCLLSDSVSLRRRRIECLVLFVTGLPLAILVLAGWFWHIGAGRDLLTHTILINLGWAREVSWQSGARMSLLLAFGIFVLAYSQAIKELIAWRNHLAAATPEGLFVSLFLVGTLAFVSTPAPYWQAVLYFLTPAAVYFAVSAVFRYSESPATLFTDRGRIAGAGLLCLAGLELHNVPVVLILWGGLFWYFMLKAMRPDSASEHRKRSFVILLAPSLIFLMAHMIDQCRKHEVSEQQSLMAFLSTHTRPDEPPLFTWPILLPFRPSPAYHGWWLPTADLDYLAAIQAGRTRAMLANPERLSPRLKQFVKEYGHLVPETPTNRDHLTLIVFSHQTP